MRGAATQGGGDEDEEANTAEVPDGREATRGVRAEVAGTADEDTDSGTGPGPEAAAVPSDVEGMESEAAFGGPRDGEGQIGNRRGATVSLADVVSAPERPRVLLVAAPSRRTALSRAARAAACRVLTEGPVPPGVATVAAVAADKTVSVVLAAVPVLTEADAVAAAVAVAVAVATAGTGETVPVDTTVLADPAGTESRRSSFSHFVTAAMACSRRSTCCARS